MVVFTQPGRLDYSFFLPLVACLATQEPIFKRAVRHTHTTTGSDAHSTHISTQCPCTNHNTSTIRRLSLECHMLTSHGSHVTQF